MMDERKRDIDERFEELQFKLQELRGMGTKNDGEDGKWGRVILMGGMKDINMLDAVET